MKILGIISIYLLLQLTMGQNYPNDNQNYNRNNDPNYNPNNPNNNPNYYNSNNPNYDNNRNNPNYSQYNPNYNSNPNYNPNYNSTNNQNYNPNNSNYNNNPYSNNPYGNNPGNSNYNPNNRDSNYNPYNRDSNYNSNNRDSNYNPNNRDSNYNPNYSQSNQNYNQNNNQNFGNRNYNPNPGFSNLTPLDQGDCCEEYCYTQDPEPYLHFGTKTAYDSISRRGGNQHNIPDCTPIQFWSIIRHGTRLPDADTIRTMRNMNRIHDEVAKNYEQRRSYPDRGKVCAQDYDLFRRWRFNESINEGNANSLAKQGVDDMKLLARRWKAKYADLLQNYDERSYYFQYSMDDRTHDSFQAYIEGLFDQDAFRVHANTINGNRLTNPFQNCPRWQDNENSKFISQSEVERFKQKSDYQKMVRDVFRRLGFRFTLNATVIEDIYNLCRYEKAWNPQPRSPWCVAFTREQLKILEYLDDLQYFYESGYGNKLAERLGCSSVKDMYERFERTVNGISDGNKAAFIFGETATFISALTALGINKDYNMLNADNYYQQNRRSWRTSLMSPFGANLVATLYQCNRGERHRVMFFLNEIPVEFPDCSVGLCNWSTIQQKYESLMRSCNVDDICSDRRNSASKQYVTVLIFITTVFLLRL